MIEILAASPARDYIPNNQASLKRGRGNCHFPEMDGTYNEGPDQRTLLVNPSK
jgi:hypothetical protein